MSHSSQSPMEQGELGSEREFGDSPGGIELDPESDQDSEASSSRDERDSGRRERHDDVDDSLDIKPPQAHTSKRDKHKSHKHKDGRRDRERHRERDAERDRGKHRDKSKGSKPRPKQDERIVERDRQREDQIQSRGETKEYEKKRREKSQRERERLERLERERFRLERQQKIEHQERVERSERERRERERMATERDRFDRRGRDDDRSRRAPATRQDIARRGRDKDVDRRKEKQRPDKYNERSRSPVRDDGKRDRRGERERPRISPIRGPQTPPEEEEEEEDEYQEPEEPAHALNPGESDRESVSESAEESGSESSSGSEESESDSAGASEHSLRENREDRHRDHGKVKSKFDDDDVVEEEHTDVESEEQQTPPQEEVQEVDGEYLDATPPQSPIELKPELPPYYPGIQGCRSVEEFHCLNRIEEGTYGVVYRARDKKTDEIVALKRLKMEKEKEGFPITSLREINTLLKSQHTNIVTVREIVVGSNMDKIYIVMDYVEHDMKSLMETMKEPFMIGEVKTLMIQLMRGVNHLHDNWIIHRDLKTSNLLLSHKGILKIGDFGLAREYGSPLKQYTPIVVTLWYRSPELLLGTKEYSTAIDMWSVGCIFAEFLTRKALFPGKSEIDELNRIFKELGTPNEKIWPGVGELPAMKKCSFTEYPYNQLRNKFGSLLTDKGFDLMNRFLTYNPTRRISAEEALKHEYIREAPAPVDPSMFPTWPAKSEQSRKDKANHVSSPKPPSGGKAYANLIGDDDVGGFHLSYATKGAAAQGGGFSLKF